MGSLMKQSAIAGLALLLSMVAPGAAQEARGPAPTVDAVVEPATRGPELPRSSIVVGPVPDGRRTVHVPAGGSLQAALDRARPVTSSRWTPARNTAGRFDCREKTATAGS